jgi:hypothetical protein
VGKAGSYLFYDHPGLCPQRQQVSKSYNDPECKTGGTEQSTELCIAWGILRDLVTLPAGLSDYRTHPAVHLSEEEEVVEVLRL